MMYTDKELDGVEYYVDELGRVAALLRMFGIAILLCTVAHLGVVGATVSRLSSLSVGLSVSAVFFISVILFAVMFEQLRRRGEVTYGEVADELHNARSEPGLENFRLSFRIVLKNFASSVDLPLVPGRYGLSLYVLLNLGLTIYIFLAFNKA